MCVHDEHGNQPHDSVSYERGVAMPMFLGATSKVILANLPERTLKAIYLKNERKIRDTLAQNGWNEFKEQIRSIKRAGFAVTDSEVAEGRVGLAAPISRGDVVIAGISLVITPNSDQRKKLSEFASSVVASAALISAELTSRIGPTSR
jgi:DNA-binding IclR family transcriptional regulator